LGPFDLTSKRIWVYASEE